MSIEQITTPQELEGLRDVGMAVVLTDDGYPAIVWMGEDQAWHSIRAVNEDDGPWENQPAHVRRSLAVNAGIDLDREDCLPLTVLWRDDLHSSLGANLIAAERRRQIEVEGYTAEHDDDQPGQMALAAACYSTPANRLRQRRVAWSWPWPAGSWKPTPDDRVRELVKAGALCLAENERIEREIDRLLRAQPAPIEPAPAQAPIEEGRV